MNLGVLLTICCSFVNILYFGLKFLQYTLNILLSKYVKKIDFLKPEHETTFLGEHLTNYSFGKIN